MDDITIIEKIKVRDEEDYGQSSEDIGILCGITRYAADCRLYHTRRRLRKYLKEADIQ